jgi:cytochrome c oxidase cbb3-type subunit II
MSLLKKHQVLEKKPLLLLAFTIVTVLIGGIIEIIPLFRMETVIEKVEGVRPYTPLELAGQDIFIREGCYNCHSQQIRPLRDEVARYGHYSLAAESMYDHPFQWGSKRTGPDLARVGGKYSDEWHVRHLINPRDVVPESIMPPYSRMMNQEVKFNSIEKHMRALRVVGVPYTDDMLINAERDLINQAHNEAAIDSNGLVLRYGDKVNIRDFDGQPNMVSEMDALVAYLQVLGTMVDFQKESPVKKASALPTSSAAEIKP